MHCLARHVGRNDVCFYPIYPYVGDYLTRQIIADRNAICHRWDGGLVLRHDWDPFFPPVASIPRRTCMLANGCGQITALPAFETLLTLRILARRARLTSLCPVENDDITIKLPSAYGNWLNYQISSTNINTSTPRDRASGFEVQFLNGMNLPVRRRSFDVHSPVRLYSPSYAVVTEA